MAAEGGAGGGAPTSAVLRRPGCQRQHHDARNDARENHRSDVSTGALEQPEGDQRPQHRTGVIETALQTKRSASQGLRRDIRDQRIARRRAQAFSQPVHHAQTNDLPGGRGHGDHGPYDDRDQIADDDQGAAARHAIGETSGDELDDCGGRIGGAVERPQRDSPTPEHPGHERREQRVDHLAGEVVQERDGTEQFDLPREPPPLTHRGRVPSVSA